MSTDEMDLSASPTGSCGLCKTALVDEAPISCSRCKTLYHSTCWTYNLKRCAVYGCEKEPIPERPIVQPVPAEPSGSGWRWGGGWLFLLFAMSQVCRFAMSDQDDAAERRQEEIREQNEKIRNTREMMDRVRSFRRLQGMMRKAEEEASRATRHAERVLEVDPLPRDKEQLDILHSRGVAGMMAFTEARAVYRRVVQSGDAPESAAQRLRELDRQAIELMERLEEIRAAKRDE